MSASNELVLHPRLCHRNFWMNSCHRNDCNALHIRRPGRKLVIFNASANLNRIDRKLGSSTLANMKMPVDSELYVVDSQIYPEDFGYSIAFKDPRIFVAKSIGLHPANAAPKAYYDLFKTGLTTIDQHFGLAYTGPFGGNNNGRTEERATHSKLATFFTNTVSSASQNKFGARCTALGHKDNELLQQMTPCIDASPQASVFLSASKNGLEPLARVMDLLRAHPNIYATFSSESNVSCRQKILAVMDRSSSRKILLESASPSSRTTNASDLLPLSVVNFVVDLFVDFQKDKHFRDLGYSLAEFNGLFTENGFNMVQKRLFQLYNSTETLDAFDLSARQTLGLAYRTHRDNMSYGRATPALKPKPLALVDWLLPPTPATPAPPALLKNIEAAPTRAPAPPGLMSLQTVQPQTIFTVALAPVRALPTAGTSLAASLAVEELISSPALLELLASKLIASRKQQHKAQAPLKPAAKRAPLIDLTNDGVPKVSKRK